MSLTHALLADWRECAPIWSQMQVTFVLLHVTTGLLAWTLRGATWLEQELWHRAAGSANHAASVVVWQYMADELEATRYQCAGCGEWNETTVDPSGGRRQEYVEDCQVCCKPNVLHIEWGDGEWWVRAELE